MLLHQLITVNDIPDWFIIKLTLNNQGRVLSNQGSLRGNNTGRLESTTNRR
jgi:hypothetical protein